ncbi:MAG: hypothetical protein Q8M16_20935 [Pirellulaceae bacterium]|nr:hypothetical protein [Pirellulaceae bacterium]
MPSDNESIPPRKSVAKALAMIEAGASILLELQQSFVLRDNIRFATWSHVFRQSSRSDYQELTREQTMWVWETLRTAPGLVTLFGSLEPATAPWKSQRESIHVLDAEAKFYIGLNQDGVHGLLDYHNPLFCLERAWIKTKQPLLMRPGKHDRLECCDCRSEVYIQFDQPSPIGREADILNVEPERIRVEDNTIIVTVDSLNQAYTVASRRLEPKRRGHGGRIYEHLVLDEANGRTLLENLRIRIEQNAWEQQERDLDRIDSIFAEPAQWGLRGDRFHWRELQLWFMDEGLPATEDLFGSQLKKRSMELVGRRFEKAEDQIYVSRYDQGGMSGGHLSVRWWQETGFPLLIERYSASAS